MWQKIRNFGMMGFWGFGVRARVELGLGLGLGLGLELTLTLIRHHLDEARLDAHTSKVVHQRGEDRGEVQAWVG